jgi:hypothetical protein
MLPPLLHPASFNFTAETKRTQNESEARDRN